MVECWTRDLKVASSSSGRSGGKVFLSRPLCADCYSVSVPPCVTAVVRKRPRSFCQKCRWQVIPTLAYVLDPRSRSGLTMLSWHSRGTYQDNRARTQLVRKHSATVVSSRWASLDWFWPEKWNGIGVRELISTLKQRKSAGGEWIVKLSPQIIASEKRATAIQWHCLS